MVNLEFTLSTAEGNHMSQHPFFVIHNSEEPSDEESKASARKTANAPSVVPAQAGTQGRGLSLPARRAVPQFAHTQRMKTQMVGGGLITI